MTSYEIQVSEDKSSLALAASDLIAQIVESTLNIKSKARIALCGGSTPKSAYSLLGKKILSGLTLSCSLEMKDGLIMNRKIVIAFY